MRKANNDYSERFGVISQPINQEHCTDSPVIHTILRTMDTYAEACCCLVAGVKIWTSSSFKNPQLQFVKAARNEIRQGLKLKGIAWDLS